MRLFIQKQDSMNSKAGEYWVMSELDKTTIISVDTGVRSCVGEVDMDKWFKEIDLKGLK